MGDFQMLEGAEHTSPFLSVLSEHASTALIHVYSSESDVRHQHFQVSHSINSKTSRRRNLLRVNSP